MPITFLKAEWRKLVMAQYEVAPRELLSRVPPGLELDLYEGRCFVSLVGFLFDSVRILGVPVPFHTSFVEVNLRYYVRRPMPDGTSRRGVVFLSEIVPKRAITTVARLLYGEAYSTARTRHQWTLVSSPPRTKRPKRRRWQTPALAERERPGAAAVSGEALNWRPAQCQIEYEWEHKGRWQRLGVRAENRCEPIVAGSLDEFITEHYWGYTPTREGGTAEYAVDHRRWQAYPVQEHRISCDFASLYGREFAGLTGRAPDHVLLAEGAPVAIKWGGRIA